MKKLLTVAVLCAFALLLYVPAGADSAQGAVLIEAETKTVLYAKNADKRLPMASTTKIMTAIVAIESAPLSTVFTVSPKAANTEGSSMYLKAGERLSLLELLYGLMLSSGNDAAVTIAEGVAGSEERFVTLMNAKASGLGLLNTRFETVSGLDGEGHFSTAYDMAVLTAYALENGIFAGIVATKTKRVGERYLVNHNKLLFNYEYAVGVKTGYTKAAGRCLVSAARKNGVTLIAVTLSDADDWNDHISLYERFFGSVKRVDYCSADDRYKLPVVGAECGFIVARPEKDFHEIYFSENNYKVAVELPRFVYAPVKKGDIVGRVCVYDGDRVIDSVCIVAEEDAAVKNNLKSLLYRLFGKK